MSLLTSIFGNKQTRNLKGLKPLLNKVNALEENMKKLSDEELKAQTEKFKTQIKEGAKLDDLLPEAFATVREASVRVLGMRHFDVQIMGGIVLYQGRIAEMKTGEGKTLTATLPMYLMGLTGRGAHLVTVNDYLASRDAEEMGVLYKWLGLSVGCILADMEDEDRQAAYQADITYGTNNEFAFDYLRDNMKFDLDQYVQREHHYCIVDEVDSILIDEARTPLLISGPSEGNVNVYGKVNRVIPQLKKDEHYTVDEKSHSAVFTDEGIVEVQRILNVENLFDIQNVELLHHLNQSLKAYSLFKRDVNYVVKDGKVIIVDEFTGRLKEGSRWSDGLHQAVEAKEGVEVKTENQTLASVTFQNYFKLYSRLSGMTGTAETEEKEFITIYGLDVVVIPTNKPMVRDDQADQIYKTKAGKFKAVSELIKELHEKGQPALVGTISIETSEYLSSLLTKAKIPHEVLNAKQHEREASIVADAGRKGGITIATNMAGRGTDIKITDEIKSLGGLFIIGTERHESRRIDNQLRGRSGRQGDPGASRFFLSLEDDLMRIFGSDKIQGIMGKLGMEEDEPIEHRMISNAIAKAQTRVEGHNFDIRKHLLDFDNVMNEQRSVIYRIRREILSDQDNMGLAQEMLEDVISMFVDNYKPEGKVTLDSWPWEDIQKGFQTSFRTEQSITALECSTKHQGEVEDYLLETARNLLKEKLQSHPEEQVKLALREVLLSVFDQHWKDHLLSMDHMKEGINLRAYAQKDPLNEYKHESFKLFEEMKTTIKKSVVETLFGMTLYTEEQMEELRRQHEAELEAQLDAHRRASEQEQAGRNAPVRRKNTKVGRNDPCPCGSGKKFKHCHGA